MQQKQTRIALVGPSGAGKSTTAWLIHHAVGDAAVISLSQPLRDLQDHAYDLLGMPRPGVAGTQDGVMLQQLRDILLNRNAEILASIFIRTVNAHAQQALIVNDDCRLASKPCLDSLGFVYVWVDGGPHGHARGDPSRAQVTGSAHDAIIPERECAHTLDNKGTIGRLDGRVAALLSDLKVGVP